MPSVKYYKGYPHIGVSTIAACLMKAGHNVKLLHIFSKSQENTTDAILESFSPDIVGISATTNQFNTALQVAQKVRAYGSSVKIIIGGIHSILNPDQVITHPEFDFVCRGEGEKPMLYIAGKMENELSLNNTPVAG
jgi:radical SAM superfamily enzyme YgiQ (UPF0313 family)